MTAVLWFYFGAVIGSVVGFFAAALCHASARNNERGQFYRPPVEEEEA